MGGDFHASRLLKPINSQPSTLNSPPAVFLDRDGTLMEEAGYPNDPDQVRAIPGAGDALRRLAATGYRIFIITNQSGIGRGRVTPSQFDAVQRELLRQLGDGAIDGTYFCPDLPHSGSLRRKPSPAMVLEAAHDHGVDLARSFFVGDKSIDIECGKNAGVRTILVETGYGASQEDCNPDHRAKDVVAAVEFILKNTHP